MDSKEMTAEPFDSWLEPASSNQFSGDSTAYSATLRAPPSTGTTADFVPVQPRLPLTSMRHWPLKPPPKVVSTPSVLLRFSSFSKRAVMPPSLLLMPTMARPESAVASTPVPPSAPLSPQTPYG